MTISSDDDQEIGKKVAMDVRRQVKTLNTLIGMVPD